MVNNTVYSSRIAWVDTAKGIGITLVLVYHLHPAMPIQGYKIITAFFLPLFFFLSGMFFKQESFKDFMVKKFGALIVPLLFFYWLSCAQVFVRQLLGVQFDNPFQLKNFLDPFMPYETLYINRALWFLMSLFWVNLLFFAIACVNKYKSGGVIFMTLIGLSGMALPYYIDTSLVAIAFFYLGYLYKRKHLDDLEIGTSRLWLIAVVCFVVLCLFCSESNMEKNYYSNPWIFHILACIGIIMVTAISKALGRVPLLTDVLGKYSLIILATHLLFRNPVEAFSHKFGLDQWVAVFILLMIECIIAPLTAKLFPYLTGQKKMRV